MSILDFFRGNNEPKNEQTVTYGNKGTIESFFGLTSEISEEEALQIPAVSSAVGLIAGSIAQLQFMLIKKDEHSGEITRKSDDYRLYLLNRQPNETMDAYTYKKAIVKDYLLYGASHTKIERNLNSVTGLYLLPSNQITVETYVYKGYKRYSELILNNASGTFRYKNDSILSVLRDSKDGLTGVGILKQNHKILQLALAETDYSSNVLRNGALPIGVLETESKLSDKAFTNLKNSWAKLYQGAEKAGKTVILEEGLKYNPISMKPNDLELINSKKSTLSEIARIFNVPESMINANANKYGSNEQNNLNFLQYCVSPIISAIEDAVNKELLLESEKANGFEFKLDPSRLLQTTRKERAEAVGAEFKEGLISFWEARNEIDRPKTVDDDYFKLSLGAVLYKYKTDEMIIPNTMYSKANIEKQKEEEEKGGDEVNE